MRPLFEWMAPRANIVKAALSHTEDPFTLENGESFTVRYSLSASKPTVTIEATMNLQKIYNETDGSFTILADGVPDDPQLEPVDEPPA